MVKHKSDPKKGNKAGYAARIERLVKDKTKENEAANNSGDGGYSGYENERQQHEKNQTLLLMRKATAPTATMKRSKATTSNSSVKKRIKYGTRALQEIKRLQRSTDLCIPKAPFLRIIREIIFETTNDSTYRITEGAVEALREASESFIVSLMENSYLLALHAKRVTLLPRDINLLLRL